METLNDTPADHAGADTGVVQHSRAPVAMLMSAPIATAQADWTLPALERLLVEHRVNGVAVVKDQRLVGVVSRADVLRQLCVERAEAEWLSDYYTDLSGFQDRERENESFEKIAASVGMRCDTLTVGAIMSTPAIAIGVNADIEQAARTMHERRVHRLPVIDADGRLLGMITSMDIVAWVAGIHTTAGVKA